MLNEGAQIKFKKTNNIFHPSQGLAIQNLKKVEIYIYCCNLKLSISIPFLKFKYFKILEKISPAPHTKKKKLFFPFFAKKEEKINKLKRFDLPIIKDPGKKKKKNFDDTQAGEILMQRIHL